MSHREVTGSLKNIRRRLQCEVTWRVESNFIRVCCIYSVGWISGSSKLNFGSLSKWSALPVVCRLWCPFDFPSDRYCGYTNIQVHSNIRESLGQWLHRQQVRLPSKTQSDGKYSLSKPEDCSWLSRLQQHSIPPTSKSTMTLLSIAITPLWKATQTQKHTSGISSPSVYLLIAG